jgi:hexulose-6-phosphate isomerase
MSDSMHPTSRRRFLQTSAATLIGGAALTGSAGSARAGELAGRIQKAVKYHMIRMDIPVLEKFKLLKELGYDGVEPRVRDEPDVKTFNKAQEKTGIQVHGVVNSNNPDINSAVDLARSLGGDSVLVVAGQVSRDRPYDKNYREWQQIIGKALPYAEKHDVRILIENVRFDNFLLSPLEMARFIDELDSPFVGAYLDTGNMVGDGWPEQWIRILGDRVGKLDIKDRDWDSEKRIDLGTGFVDWAKVRQALLDIDFRGWATAEMPGGGRERLKGMSDRMDNILGLK